MNTQFISIMGNNQPKSKQLSEVDRRWHSSYSQGSFSSVHSTQSTVSLHRQWSRSSKRYTKQLDAFEASKTVWPVSVIESIFLPDFPIKGVVNEHDFEILKTIAKGAFGQVLQVKKKTDGFIYAMKVIYKSQVLLENAVQQCKDEVSIQHTLGHHPFIVKCSYFWQTKKHLFIVTNFVEHGELLTLWKEHSCFPESLVKIYIAEIAIALNFLNNAGVIYRDLKMENILLDESGHIQLIDFGLAKWVHYGGRAKTICGTIQYMAPEILNMNAYTHAVDWWSLGIIAYALLMGHYPIEGIRNHTKMCEVVEDFDYSLPSDRFSNGMQHMLRKLLCKIPSKRLRNIVTMKKEFVFRDLDFEDLTERRISPKKICDDFLKEKAASTADEPSNHSSESENQVEDVFKDFAWVSS